MLNQYAAEPLKRSQRSTVNHHRTVRLVVRIDVRYSQNLIKKQLLFLKNMFGTKGFKLLLNNPFFYQIFIV